MLAAWTGADGKTLARSASPPTSLARPDGWVPAGDDRSTRLADVIVTWSYFQHFYPYFDVVKVDWPSKLKRSLVAAATDSDDKAFRLTLARLVAALQDGHGNVGYGGEPKGQLPLVWDWIEDRLVVTAAAPDAKVKPGDVIERLAGEPVEVALAREMAKFSGTERWRRRRAMDALLRGDPGDRRTLGWTNGTVRGSADITFAKTQFAEPRPPAIAEIKPGIFYVDISRASDDEVEAVSARLAVARGVLFDLRGYPRGSGWLEHLASRPFKSMPMNVPVVTRPDRQGWEWQSNQWEARPAVPHWSGKLIFLTDARAISWAETLLSIAKGNHLATIVGSPTAGANGNINPFPLPGGYTVFSTGMQVLGMDGTPHHNVGVLPDVNVTRTIEGVRAGRDEVLEASIRLAGG